MIAQIIFVSVGMIILDFVWGRYVHVMAHGSSIIASNYAVLITIVSGFVTVAFVHNNWLLIPAAVGAWIGTYAAKKW